MTTHDEQLRQRDHNSSGVGVDGHVGRRIARLGV